MSDKNDRTPNHLSPDPDLPKKRVRVLQGVETCFDLDKQTIVSVWLSNWTGREVIRLNDQIVASKHSLTFESHHPFVHDGKEYSVTIKLEKFIRFRIELWQGNELMDFDLVTNGRIMSRGRGAEKANTKTVIISLLMGGALGVAGASLGYWLAGFLGAWAMRIDANLIKQKRQLHGWTQQHLSDVTGMSLRTIQRVESQGQGSHETISALASVFEIDRQTLLIAEPMEPAQPNVLG